MSMISTVINLDTDNFEQGTINNSGSNDSSHSRIRTIDYITVPNNSLSYRITCQDTSGNTLRTNVMMYNASNSCLWDSGWQTDEVVYDTQYYPAKIRIVISKTDNSNISPFDISICTLTIKSYETEDVNIDFNFTNLNDWTKNNGWSASFENVYSNKVNNITYTGGSMYEHLYCPLTVIANTNYVFSFDYYSNTGFTLGGYGSDVEYIGILSNSPSSNGEYKNFSRISETVLDNQASDEYTHYSIAFNSGNRTIVYPTLDFGYILDGVQIRFNFANFSLTKQTIIDANNIFIPISNNTQLQHFTKFEYNQFREILTQILVNTSKTIQWQFVAFNSSDSVVYTSDWCANNQTIVIDYTTMLNINTWYLRLKYTDGSNISPDDIISCNISTKGFNWYIDVQEDEEGNEVKTLLNTGFTAMELFTKPFPNKMWKVENDELFNFVDSSSMLFTKPFPDRTFIITDNEFGDAELTFGVKEELLGAFTHVNSLVSAIIPKTTISIGEYSFVYSGISSIKISNDCIYNNYTFPKDCKINKY